MTIKYNVSGAKARNGAVIMPMDFDSKREAERFANYHEGLAFHTNIRQHPGKVQAWSDDAADFAPTVEDDAAAKSFFDGLQPSGHNGQAIGRIRRRNFTGLTALPVSAVVDVKTLTDGIEPYTGPTLIMPLPKCKEDGEHGPWDDNNTYCVTCGYYDKSRAQEEHDGPLHDGKQAYIGCPCEGCAAWRKSPANYQVIAVTHHAEDRSVGFTVELNPITLPTQLAKAAPVGNAADPLAKAIQINDDLEEAYAMGFRAAVATETPSVNQSMAEVYIESQDYADQRRSDLKELISFDRSLN